jgi:hypothetical protein
MLSIYPDKAPEGAARAIGILEETISPLPKTPCSSFPAHFTERPFGVMKH